jgi:outer membrane protein OmpA-like peptidoglycan-associated protein
MTRQMIQHSPSHAKSNRPAPAPRSTRQATTAVGLPRFLRYRVPPGALAGPSSQGAEAEARNFAAGGQAGPVIRPESSVSSPAQSLAQASVRAASARSGPGTPLPETPRRRFESTLGGDLGDVRIHTEGVSGAVADSVGANAYTLGRDIYFGRGKYQPDTPTGEQLLAHEMAHVAQHGSDRSQLHADLAMSLPTGLGVFGIDMADRVAPARAGMEGHITFDPDPNGPYSAEIGLIQAVRFERGGVTARPGGGSSAVGFPATESERDVLATTGSQGEKAGWHVDTTYSDPAKTSGSQTSPSYPESVGFNPAHNEHGFLRSPTDLQQARLYDYPGGPDGIRFEFETVAKGMDSQSIYGGLHWGFAITSGAPTAEYAYAMNTTSAEFDISLDRFRAYFTHEPVIVYFDTDVGVPAAGEAFKLDEAMQWLNKFPDAHVEVEGFADERGAAGYNAGLSRRRANSVAAELIGRGLDASRIDSITGSGETTVFAAGNQKGQLQANRRVRVRFVRNASTPPGP